MPSEHPAAGTARAVRTPFKALFAVLFPLNLFCLFLVVSGFFQEWLPSTLSLLARAELILDFSLFFCTLILLATDGAKLTRKRRIGTNLFYATLLLFLPAQYFLLRAISGIN